ILVRPGRYAAALHLDRPVEIVGAGPAEQIVLEGTRGDLIDFQADWGRIANLTLRQLGRGDQSTAIGIQGGLLQVEDCDITSGNYGIYLYTNAVVQMQRCRVHDCGGVGVYLERWAEATLEENAITGNRSDAVVVWQGSKATLRRNRITGNAGVAIKLSARSH